MSTPNLSLPYPYELYKKKKSWTPDPMTWEGYETGGENPRTWEDMEAGGPYERAWEDLETP